MNNQLKMKPASMKIPSKTQSHLEIGYQMLKKENVEKILKLSSLFVTTKMGAQQQEMNFLTWYFAELILSKTDRSG